MFKLRPVARFLVFRTTSVSRGFTRGFTYSKVQYNEFAKLDNANEHANQVKKVADEVKIENKTESISTQDVPEDGPATFDGLAKTGHVHKDILKAIKLAKFTTLTPVQEKSLVPILEENGVVCRAKTGTGKTLAFVIPTLQCALENFDAPRGARGKVHALVIAPTRDLALQIESEYKKIIQNMPNQAKNKIHMEVHMGGRKTRTGNVAPAIVIATPGRLNDNLRHSRFANMFTDLKYRVYDEADRLLDEGFSVTLDDIDDQLKQARSMATNPNASFKSVLFSATVDKSVSNFAKSVMGEDYKFINCVDENEPEAHENIEQTLVKTNNIGESFNGALAYIINNMNNAGFKAMVFLPTVTATDWFYSMLMNAKDKEMYDTQQTRKYGSKLLRLHGKMSQAARDRTVRDYRRLSHGILVCTDVAARGLDFSDVSDVVQMGPSSEVADYIHKIGRTARAGASGRSILFLSSLEKNYSKALQSKRGVKFEHEIKYETAEEDKKLVQEIGADVENVESFIPTFLGFYKQVGSAYKIAQHDSLSQIIDYYRFLINDPEAKLSVGKGFLRNVISVPPREASLYFDVPGGFNFTATNNRSSKRTFMDTSGDKRKNFKRGGFNKNNDDHGSRGYSDKGNYSRQNFGASRNTRNDYSKNNSRDFKKTNNKRDNRWGSGNDEGGW